MKHRSLPKMFGLFIITLGVYRLYWLAKTRKELLQLKPDAKILGIWVYLIPYVLLIGSLILLTFSAINEARRQHDAGCVLSSTSSTSTVNQVSEECQDRMPVWVVGLLYLACASFFPITALWTWGYSQTVERVTGEKMSFALAMIVLLAVPDGFDMLVVQDSFNKIASAPSPPTKTPKAAKAAA